MLFLGHKKWYLKKLSKIGGYVLLIHVLDLYSTSIKYDHNHQHQHPIIESYQMRVKQRLQDLAINNYHESKFNSAEKFFDLVISLRHLNLRNIAAIIASVDLKKESFRYV